MTFELMYTSAERGLALGSHGFCTVVSTQGMQPSFVTALESLSGYRHLQLANASNPVVWSHVRLKVDGRTTSVLSRVADYGKDYSGRSNKLAHHLAVATTEQTLARPAWLLRQPNFLQATWDGQTRKLTSGRPIPRTNPPPPQASAHWKQTTGDAGWAGIVADELITHPTRSVYIIIKPDCDALPLIDEVSALLPLDSAWDLTFTSFYTSIPKNADCQLRFVLQGTREAEEARKSSTTCIDLESLERSPEQPTNDSAYVRFARTGNATHRPQSNARSLLESGRSNRRAHRTTYAIDEPINATKPVPSAPAIAPRRQSRPKISLALIVALLSLLIPILSFGAYRILTVNPGPSPKNRQTIATRPLNERTSKNSTSNLLNQPNLPDIVNDNLPTKQQVDVATLHDNIIEAEKQIRTQPAKAITQFTELEAQLAKIDNDEHQHLLAELSAEQEFANAILNAAEQISAVPLKSIQAERKLGIGLLEIFQKRADHVSTVAENLEHFIDAEKPNRTWLPGTVKSILALSKTLRPANVKAKNEGRDDPVVTDVDHNCPTITTAIDNVESWHHLAIKRLRSAAPIVLYIGPDGRSPTQTVVAQSPVNHPAAIRLLGQLATEGTILSADGNAKFQLKHTDNGFTLRESPLPDDIGLFSFDGDRFFEMKSGKLPKQISNFNGAQFSSRYGRLLLLFGDTPTDVTLSGDRIADAADDNLKKVFSDARLSLGDQQFKLPSGKSTYTFPANVLKAISAIDQLTDDIESGEVKIVGQRIVVSLSPSADDLRKRARNWALETDEKPFNNERPQQIIKDLGKPMTAGRINEEINTRKKRIVGMAFEDALKFKREINILNNRIKQLNQIRRKFLNPRLQAEALDAIKSKLEITGTIAITLRDRDGKNQVDIPVYRIVKQ